MSIWAWGANACGQLGLGFASEQVSLPVKLDLDGFVPDSLKKLKSKINASNILISGGGTETCVVFSPREKEEQVTVVCLGLSVHPQIGAKRPDLEITRKAVPGFATRIISQIGTPLCHLSSGWDFHLAVDQEGSVSSWGNNAFGQLGHGSTRKDFPFVIQGLKSVSVAAGLRHSAAVTVDGRLFLWGDNSKGLLGVGSDAKTVDTPKEACFSGGDKPKFLSVQCGKGFTIACDTRDQFWGCGTNKFEQLGKVKGDLMVFTRLDIGPFESRVKKFVCGWNHTLVLLESGDIVGWGRNNFFQLGGSKETHQVPRKLEGLVEPIATIACGSEHSLALGASGKVYSWGWNEHDNCGVPSNCSSQASLSDAVRDKNQSEILDCVRGPAILPFPSEAGKILQIGCGYALIDPAYRIRIFKRWNMPRIFNLQGMVDEAMQNRLPRIGSEVCPAHVIRVWESVSCFIEEQFRAGKGVRIPNLLKITYRVQRNQVSQQNVIANRIPVLLLAEDVAKKYFITVKKPTFNLSLPEVPLNLSAIALTTGLPRSVVETCVQEVIQAFHRALVMDHNVQFHLHGIGRLIIENRYCYATFCKCFMEKFEFERPRNKHGACAF